MANICLGDTYVDFIERTECIGNSLAKINDNFKKLDIQICGIEGTTSVINTLQGVIKGNGVGGFEVADPVYDYYVPGSTMYSDLNITGAFNCGKTITIGGNGSLAVPGGNVGCINLNATGTGSFAGSITTQSSVVIGGKCTVSGDITANTLTINNATKLNGTLTVANQIDAGSTITAPTISTPSLTVTGTNGSITVPAITITKSLNADGSNINSNFFRTNINTAEVQILSAYDGIFSGSKVTSTNGSFTLLNSGTTTTSLLTATNAKIPTLDVPTIINSVNFTGNKITLNDRLVEGGTIQGTIKATVVDTFQLTVNTVKATNANIDATINAATVNGTIVNGTTKVYSKLGEFIDVTASGTITLGQSNGTITNGGYFTGKSFTAAAGNNIADGIISAASKVTAPTVQGTTVNTQALNVQNGAGTNVIQMDASTSKIIFNQSAAQFEMTGPASSFKLNGANSTFYVANVNASYISCTGDIVAYSSSDKQLKKNIKVIPDALEKVSTLRGVSFDWDEELQPFQQGADTGIIAQEVEEVMPTAVTTRENGYKAVKYDRLIPLLIEAVKELKEQNVALKEEVEALKANKCCKCK